MTNGKDPGRDSRVKIGDKKMTERFLSQVQGGAEVVKNSGNGVDGVKDLVNPLTHTILIDTKEFRSNTTSTGTGHWLPPNSCIIDIRVFTRTDDGSKTFDIGFESDSDGIVNNHNPSAGVAFASIRIVPSGDNPTSENTRGDPQEIYMNMSAASTSLAGTVAITYATRN